MSENAQILLIIWGFWLAVVALDIVALVCLRRLNLPAVAAVLWTIWIVVGPIVGAVSFFIVARAVPPAGICASCGYDLRGSPGPACPECGAAVRKPSGVAL